jgi:hypothetical protein
MEANVKTTEAKMRLGEYEKKYLLRLNQAAIAHAEFARWGKAAVATIEAVGAKGLAERVDLDGNPTDGNDPDAYWQITEAGEAQLAK